MTSPPSSEATRPSKRRRSPSRVACAAMGTWQPPPRLRSSARSASTAARVGAWSRRETSALVCASSVRVSTPSAPWLTAGSISSVSMAAPMRAAKPRRRRPAEASITASNSPASSLRRRVSTFPRRSLIWMSGRRCLSCAMRRRLDVPTTAPGGRFLNDAFEASVLARRTSASRGSSRSGVAAIERPSGMTVGRSLSEWTAMSTRRSRSANSISFVNAPCPPIADSGTSRITSPDVLITSTRTETFGSSASSRAFTHSDCHSASFEPREPMTSSIRAVNREP